VGDILEHHRQRPDAAVVADADAAEHLRIGAELDVVPDARNRAAGAPVADRHSLAQRAVGANDDLGVNEDVAKMPDAQARPDLHGLRQADAERGLRYPEQEPVETRLEPRTVALPIDAAAKPVDPEGPHRLLAQERPCRVAQ